MEQTPKRYNYDIDMQIIQFALARRASPEPLIELGRAKDKWDTSALRLGIVFYLFHFQLLISGISTP